MGNLKKARTSLESVQAYLSNALLKFRYQGIDKLLIRCITRLQRTDSGPLQPLLGDASRHDSMHAHSLVSAKRCRLHAYCWFHGLVYRQTPRDHLQLQQLLLRNGNPLSSASVASQLEIKTSAEKRAERCPGPRG